MMPKVMQTGANRNQKATKSELKGEQNTVKFDLVPGIHKIRFEIREGFLEISTFLRHLVDFGCQFCGHWILKGSPNRQFLYKIKTNYENTSDHKRCLNKT